MLAILKSYILLTTYILDPSCRLLPPKSPDWPTAITALIGALATRFDQQVGVIRRALNNAEIEEWGKVQRIDSEAGDIMRSSCLGVTQDDGRDATFVRVSFFCLTFFSLKFLYL